MIILEGPNGCGKSTLAVKLHRALDWPVYKFPTPRDPADAVRNYDVIRSGGAPDKTILDRHPMISDNVYCPIMFRGVDPIPFDADQLAGHVVVYCRAPISTAIRKHKYIAGDPFYRNEMRVFAMYDSIMYGIDCRKYDWTADSEADLISFLKKEVSNEP